MKEIIVTILSEDFAKASGYRHTSFGHLDCPLQNALERMYPSEKIDTGSSRVIIGDQRYQIPRNWGWGAANLAFPDEPSMSEEQINEMVAQAKQSLVPPFTLTLVNEKSMDSLLVPERVG